MQDLENIGRGGFIATLREGLWIAILAAALALAANAISPRGLSLTRNYFPRAASGAEVVATQLHSGAGEAAVTNGAVAKTMARLAAEGLKVVTLQETERFFRDPRFAQGLLVFLDARDDALYQAGHIPGAYQFDHYRAPTFLPTILPVCSVAEQVLVYCTGGDCEDSEFAAITLRDLGVKADKLMVFASGFHAWEAADLPVETGARNSGKLRKAQP